MTSHQIARLAGKVLEAHTTEPINRRIAASALAQAERPSLQHLARYRAQVQANQFSLQNLGRYRGVVSRGNELVEQYARHLMASLPRSGGNLQTLANVGSVVPRYRHNR